MIQNKKGQALSTLASIAVSIATLAIVLTVTFLIMSQGKEQAETISGVECNATSGDAACNATSELQSAVDDIPGWVPLIVIATIGSVLLGLVKLFR
jgi:hypothetical protein